MRDLAWLETRLEQGGWLSMTDAAPPAQLLPSGPGVLLSSGGSSGGRRCCLQPLKNLDRSSAATAAWLERIGVDPSRSWIFNPLPLNHVSGLMPWWRARAWGVPHHQLNRALMKDPSALLQHCRALLREHAASALLSLVPTQLARLMGHADGLAALAEFQVIWVGGAALPRPLADQARRAGLRLAPCYGSTETAAMVAALPPARFLAGEIGCGDPLPDVEFRLADDGALQVRSQRLGLAGWRPEQPERLDPLVDGSGWWRSGDQAVLNPGLQILGRLDLAILSGGVTVYLDQLESRFKSLIQANNLSVEAILLLGVDDAEWGQQLVALIRASDPSVLERLQQLSAAWPVAEQPRRWLLCSELAPTDAGKWDRRRWMAWLKRLDLAES